MLTVMSLSGRLAAGARRFDPARLARHVRRTTLLLAVGLGVWASAVLGTEWVPPGMRTVPTIEPGALCLVDRRASAAAVGRDVFVEVGGVRLLSRVAAVAGDELTLRNPDPLAPYPDSRAFGPVSRRQVRGTVLVVFAPDAGEGRRDG
jgi:hypothetical protein